MFKTLGVGEGDHCLRDLVMGQRRINGRLLVAIEEVKKVLDALSKRSDARTEPSKMANQATNQSLRAVSKHLKYVAGDEPPGCERPAGT